MELSRRLESDLIRDIIELSIAVEIQNKSWIKKTVMKIVAWMPEELTFRVQRYSYGRMERMKKFESTVNRLNNAVRSGLSDNFLSKAFENRIEEFLKEKTGKGYRSLAEIREELEGNRVNGKIWSFWFQKLLSRTSLKEASLLLKRKMDGNFLQSMKLGEIWLFNHYYPSREGALRKRALNKIHLAWKKGDLWLKYLVVKLIENPVIKRELAEKEPIFNRALFQIERRFYRNLLLAGKAVDFSLYNLMRLGDNNRQDFWWLVF